MVNILENFIHAMELPSLIFITLSTMILGVFVFYRDRKSASGILFIFLSLNFIIWALVNYFSLNPLHQDFILPSIRLVLFAAAPQAFLFALLMHTFPNKKIQLSLKKIISFFILLCVQMFLAISPYVFSDIKFSGGKYTPIVGWGMAVYAPIMVFFFSAGIFWLMSKFLKSPKNERKKMIIIILGFSMTILLFLFLLLFAVVVFDNAMFVPLSPVFILPFIIAVGYSLVRTDFLNIKLVTTELFTGFLTILLLTEALLSGSVFSIIWKTIFSILVGVLSFLLVRSVHREISQRKELARLARSLEKANARLKELDHQKTEFLSIASHQLRTPLSILKGYIELIEDGAYGKPTKKMIKVLGDMDESNERLVKLIDEFLDITRIEQGRTKFSFEDASLSDLIHDVVKELHARAHDEGLALTTDLSKDAKSVTMDVDRIRHVVFNYIDNAIKYSERGTIRVVLEYDEAGATVRVIDEGRGFDPVDQANFFQKFYRGENVKGTNVNGTGLGIYVCHKFIEAHGGRVWAESEGIGKGSEFGFWIPQKLSEYVPVVRVE